MRHHVRASLKHGDLLTVAARDLPSAPVRTPRKDWAIPLDDNGKSIGLSRNRLLRSHLAHALAALSPGASALHIRA
jgi:hypothetical protein